MNLQQAIILILFTILGIVFFCNILIIRKTQSGISKSIFK